MGRAIVAIAALPLAACVGVEVGHGHPEPAPTEDYRVSVEIPLREADASNAAHVAGHGRTLKIDELLDERTDFDAEDFQLDEVVLVARAGDSADSQAELLVLEWRSGEHAVPECGEEDWFEVRIPGPEEDLGGAWLLYLGGAVTVDLLVAVLAPKPPVAEQAAAAYTVYRTRTIYRERTAWPHHHGVLWLYNPARYYVYHDYGIWPYRYFIGPWDFRYYDLAYRPHHHHYAPLHRPYRAQAGRRGRPDWRGADAAQPRRISSQLVNLRRNHPRLRTLRAGGRTTAERTPAERPFARAAQQSSPRTEARVVEPVRRFEPTRRSETVRRFEPARRSEPPQQRMPRVVNRDAANATQRRATAPVRRDARTRRADVTRRVGVDSAAAPRPTSRDPVDMRRTYSRPTTESRRAPSIQRRSAERPSRPSARIRREAAPAATPQRSPRIRASSNASNAPPSEVRRAVRREAPTPRRAFERPVRRESAPRAVRTEPVRRERAAAPRESAPRRIERREAPAPRAESPPPSRRAETRGPVFERR